MRQLLREDPAVEVVWRAFELRPEPVPTLDPKGAYLQNVWRDSVYPLANKLGVPMKLPPVQPRSRRAHEAAHWAGDQGRFDQYNAALFRAFFEHGENIGDAGVLTALARGVNLDADALALALERRDFKSAVAGDERDARLMGISAVPAFVADRRVVLSGVQPVENLRRLIAEAREPRNRLKQT